MKTFDTHGVRQTERGIEAIGLLHAARVGISRELQHPFAHQLRWYIDAVSQIVPLCSCSAPPMHDTSSCSAGALSDTELLWHPLIKQWQRRSLGSNNDLAMLTEPP